MKPTTYVEALNATRSYLAEPGVTIATGWPTVDGVLKGGTRVGRVSFLIGRSEVGKTTVAVNIAAHAAVKGHHVGFASLEMTKEEVLLRALSVVYNESPDELEKWLLSDDMGKLDWMELSKQHLGLFSVDDSTKPGWDDLLRWSEQLERKVGSPPKLVVVDHLKLMKRYGYPRGEIERVQQLAEDAKAFAKDAQAAVLVIHQVGRSQEGAKFGEKNHGDIPLTMEDMMYGGEQDADVILGVYRPERNPRLSEIERQSEFGRTFLQVLKNRHGESHLSGVPLQWNRPSMRIEEEGE